MVIVLRASSDLRSLKNEFICIGAALETGNPEATTTRPWPFAAMPLASFWLGHMTTYPSSPPCLYYVVAS